MKRICLIASAFVLLFLLLPVSAAEQEVKPGLSLGAKRSETPDWFKQSFLEFEDDVAEAAAEGKRVMLYFHQDGCPYCARMVEENFLDPDIRASIQQHFDAISINMWGDREVVSFGGQGFSEKTFAAALRVQYTPTIVFLDEQGQVALRLDGYYPTERFQLALAYVAERRNDQVSFSEYVRDDQKSRESLLISEDFYQKRGQLNSLVGEGKALAVYFESADCADCQVMHEKILQDQTTRNLVIKLNNSQLDIYSEQKITTPTGRQTTAREWARDLDISYTPSVVFFDSQGLEVMRMAAFFKTFHFQSAYAYVIDKAYLTEPSFQRFIAQRAEAIREAGFDTDIWGYESRHPPL